MSCVSERCVKNQGRKIHLFLEASNEILRCNNEWLPDPLLVGIFSESMVNKLMWHQVSLGDFESAVVEKVSQGQMP